MQATNEKRENMNTAAYTPVQHALAAFAQAVADFSRTYVSDYTVQPHEWVYGSSMRPISAVWARIEGAHYIQIDHRMNNGIFTLIAVAAPLSAKVMADYELQFVNAPEDITAAWDALQATPAYVARDLSEE